MIALVYGGYLFALSLVAFGLYAADKRQAKRKGWRIPERVLLSASLLGGAFGGLIGMYACRHKTKHWYFTFTNLVAVLLHTALLIYLAISF